jgi:hypothetical protein
MTTQLELPEYLARVRAQVCGRYAAGWSTCPGCFPLSKTCTGDPHLIESLTVMPPCRPESVPGYRGRVQDARCQQCTFLLLLKAVEASLPADEIANWMERPNGDLGWKTPRACIDAGDFSRVLEALWLLSEPGPSS